MLYHVVEASDAPYAADNDHYYLNGKDSVTDNVYPSLNEWQSVQLRVVAVIQIAVDELYLLLVVHQGIEHANGNACHKGYAEYSQQKTLVSV
jgi:hypothetical protein